jgi:putative ABC transport system substrate-binding protein
VNRFWILDFGFLIGRSRSSKLLRFLIGVSLLVFWSLAGAQQRRIPRIGLLYASAVGNSARIQAFRQGLSELGYIEGENVVLEYKYAEGKLERYPILAKELVRLKVDVIVTGGPAGTGPAKELTSTIPIVMAQDNDPVGNGFVLSLPRPGGNITGLSTLGAGISGKQLELLKETVPKLSRVAVFGTSTEPANAQSLKEAERAAEALRLQVQYLDILAPKDFEAGFRDASNGRADAALVLMSAVAAVYRSEIAKLAAKNRLPAIYPHAAFVQDGGLMTYGVSFSDLDRRAAYYVDKILKAAKPADLPVEQPTKFELVINLKTAKQIGLTIPPNVLARADRVIR